jgi:hypothetical protein
VNISESPVPEGRRDPGNWSATCRARPRGAAVRGQLRVRAPPGRDGAALAAALRERSIIVRHFRQPARIAEFMRITVGTDEQCDALLEAARFESRLRPAA